jgi:hypothetical protein
MNFESPGFYTKTEGLLIKFHLDQQAFDFVAVLSFVVILSYVKIQPPNGMKQVLKLD